MCIIAVSRKGVRQPSLDQLRNMYDRNPDGAGYMFARDGKVWIHKGFMTWQDFSRAIEEEHFTAKDPVVYHFRISTQAGVNPQMTHPFPLNAGRDGCEWLDCWCDIGAAHNGIIRMTSDARETRFSDTAIFITDYLTKLIHSKEDLTDAAVLTMIDYMTNSKWAFMDSTGNIVTVGQFVNEKGLLFSNSTYKAFPKTTIIPPKSFNWDDYYLGYYGVTCK